MKLFNIREYATFWLLWLGMVVTEFHTLFFNFGTSKSNWIIGEYVPDTLDWNIKNLEQVLVPIILVGGLMLYRENKINRITRKVLFIWLIIDGFMFYLNYKQQDLYIWVYPVLAAIWIWLYKRKGNDTINISTY